MKKSRAALKEKDIFQKMDERKPLTCASSSSKHFGSIRVEEEDVKEMLMKIDANKSVGPVPYILKELSECLAGPNTVLFNFSLHNGALPDDWKIG